MIEKIIISTLIEAGLETAKSILPSIQKEHFSGRQRELIELIDSKVQANQAFDARILAEELKIEDSDGYFISLLAEKGKRNLLESYIRKLADIRAKEKIARLCSSENSHIFEKISQLAEERKLAQVEKSNFVQLKDIAVEVCEATEKKKGVDFLFRFPPLKVLASGVNAGELMIIGGYTGQAKTSLTLQLADDFACDNHSVLLCSSEMPIKEIAERIFCRRCKIDNEKFRDGNFSDDEVERIALEAMELEIPLFLARVSTANEVRAVTEKVKPQIVFVDHLHQLTGEEDSEYQIVSSSILALKNLAMEKNIAMIVVAQLHRPESVSKKGLPPRPRLSDFRSSGRIEENAQLVAFLFWKYRFTLDTDKNDKNECQLILAKSPSGLGQGKIFFRPEHYEFRRWEK